MDEGLRSLRNYYYMGHYVQVITEAKATKASNPELANGCDIYLNRALLETDIAAVFKGISAKASTGLQAVKLLGTYKTAAEDNKELVFETLKDWFSDEQVAKDPTLQLVGAQIYFEEGTYKEALRLVQNAGEDLEKLAMQVQIYLKIERVDLAAKTVKFMQDVDDDDALTQLAQSWVLIVQGGSKVTEASEQLQELVEKFGPSINVLNSQAACQIAQKNYAEAFSFLKQARSLAMSAGGKTHPDTLVNTILCLQHLGKDPAIIKKITGELVEAYPEQAWLQSQKAAGDLFETHAANYTI
jgi:coatomer protein complex subunit epsilon